MLERCLLHCRSWRDILYWGVGGLGWGEHSARRGLHGENLYWVLVCVSFDNRDPKSCDRPKVKGKVVIFCTLFKSTEHLLFLIWIFDLNFGGFTTGHTEFDARAVDWPHTVSAILFLVFIYASCTCFPFLWHVRKLFSDGFGANINEAFWLKCQASFKHSLNPHVDNNSKHMRVHTLIHTHTHTYTLTRTHTQ